ncbi:MAG: glycosyltransferase [Butyrivibrio sp.]|nr:glycosyltransferase [Butyrivibrio sp.]
MRILYYDWDEFNGRDLRDAMYRMGYHVDCFKADISGDKYRTGLETLIRDRLERYEDGRRFYDAVFSFDYFPELSEVCQKYGVSYTSWVFDCPHYPLFSDTIFNDVNRIHIFDRSLCNELTARGAKNVFHTPLGVNKVRLTELGLSLPETEKQENVSAYASSDSSRSESRQGQTDTSGRFIEPTYIHDVCFLGNLYDNEFNFYDQAKIPQDLKAYLDEVILAQQKIFGRDIFSDERVINKELLEVQGEPFRFENTGNYSIDYYRVTLDILRKKTTVDERRKIIEELGKRYNTVIYTTPDAEPVPGVTNMGVADYKTKMPYIFHNSKVNINITLRCIPSGVPLRVMDVLAAGGFLITTYQEEIADYFEDGKDLVIVNTPEEMIELAGYYLEHDDERKEIAVNGQMKVFERFAYRKLLPRILGEEHDE